MYCAVRCHRDDPPSLATGRLQTKLTRQFIILLPAPLYCVIYLRMAPVVTHQSLEQAVKCQLQAVPVDSERSCQSVSEPPSTCDFWLWADLNLTAKHWCTHSQRLCATEAVFKAVLCSRGQGAKSKFELCPQPELCPLLVAPSLY